MRRLTTFSYNKKYRVWHLFEIETGLLLGSVRPWDDDESYGWETCGPDGVGLDVLQDDVPNMLMLGLFESLLWENDAPVTIKVRSTEHRGLGIGCLTNFHEDDGTFEYDLPWQWDMLVRHIENELLRYMR